MLVPCTADYGRAPPTPSTRREHSSRVAMLETPMTMMLITAVFEAASCSCSLGAWRHTWMVLVPMLSEHFQHRPRRAAAGGSSSWSRCPALSERVRARPALQPEVPVRASHPSTRLAVRLQIDEALALAHGSLSSLLSSLAKIPAAPSTFSARCACAMHLFCTVLPFSGTRERERCWSVCSAWHGSASARHRNVSRIAFYRALMLAA